MVCNCEHLGHRVEPFSMPRIFRWLSLGCEAFVAFASAMALLGGYAGLGVEDQIVEGQQIGHSNDQV